MVLGGQPLGRSALGDKEDTVTPMPMTWYPDFCPETPGCVITVARDWSRAVFVHTCAHHETVRTNNGLSDAQLFKVVMNSSQRKEAGRWAAKVALDLPKDHPGVPYRVDADGGFTLGVDKDNVVMPEWPTGGEQTALAATIDTAVELRDTATGVSPVRSA